MPTFATNNTEQRWSSPKKAKMKQRLHCFAQAIPITKFYISAPTLWRNMGSKLLSSRRIKMWVGFSPSSKIPSPKNRRRSCNPKKKMNPKIPRAEESCCVYIWIYMLLYNTVNMYTLPHPSVNSFLLYLFFIFRSMFFTFIM
jgi:hypothetical protein